DSLGAAETAAHIHGFAPAGSPAGVLSAVALGSRAIGSWAYGAANEANVFAGLTYFNIHTSTNLGGEIRGQIQDLPAASPAPLSLENSPRPMGGLAARPNPFGARTQLSFQLSRTGSVSMQIIGVDGRVVRHVEPATFAPGAHSYEWDGMDDAGRVAAPGVYF